MAGSPPKQTTRRERLEEKERAILDAAREVFVESGYEGARMAAIAKRAGIAEGTVYIYYRTKNDLMQAVVARFWEKLTVGARAAAGEPGPTYERLAALAEYHLGILLEHFAFINLTHALRASGNDVASTRDQLRRYVAVFDEIYRRGVDLGDLDGDAELWMVRDQFYGTLEYSARTLVTREVKRPRREIPALVERMIATISASYGRSAGGSAGDDGTAETPDALLVRLESAVAKMEKIAGGRKRR